MPTKLRRLGNIFAQNRPSSEALVEGASTDPSRQASPVLWLLLYSNAEHRTMRSTSQSDLASRQGPPDGSSATMAEQIQHLHATLDRSRWPRNPQYHSQARSPAPQRRSANEPTLSGSGSPTPNATNDEALNSNIASNAATEQRETYIRLSALQRYRLIMEALQAGEEIHALHRRTLYQLNGTIQENTDQATRPRLQTLFVGDLIIRTIEYIGRVRQTYTISDKVEKTLLDRVLKLGMELQRKEILGLRFWNEVITTVGNLQSKLSKHHLEIGIEDLVTGISDVENRIAPENITQ